MYYHNADVQTCTYLVPALSLTTLTLVISLILSTLTLMDQTLIPCTRMPLTVFCSPSSLHSHNQPLLHLHSPPPLLSHNSPSRIFCFE
mmetsp:Transcript_58129/g.85190  ORF Transcript_58129/g.85190 Transcript_58129/m.85190 type:complete len:88 (-) Transcript_58129:98-361(-)